MKVTAFLDKLGFLSLLPEKTKKANYIYGTIEVDSTHKKYLKNIDDNSDNVTDFPSDFKSCLIEGNKVIVCRQYWSTEEPIHEAFINTKNMSGGIFETPEYPLHKIIFTLLNDQLTWYVYYLTYMLIAMISLCTYRSILDYQKKDLPLFVPLIIMLGAFAIGIHRLYVKKKYKNLFELYSKIYINFGIIASILVISLEVTILLPNIYTCIIINLCLYVLAFIYSITSLRTRINIAKATLNELKNDFNIKLKEKAQSFKQPCIKDDEPKSIIGICSENISLAYTGDTKYDSTIRSLFNRKAIKEKYGINFIKCKNANNATVHIYNTELVAVILFNEYLSYSNKKEKLKELKDIISALKEHEKPYTIK